MHRSSSPSQTYSSVAEGALEVAIACDGDVERPLSTEQGALIREQLGAEVRKALMVPGGCPLRFAHSGINRGTFFVGCMDQPSMDWLMTIAPQLPAWEGTKLLAVKKGDLPRRKLVGLRIPGSPQDPEEIRGLLAFQNPGLNTGWWSLVRNNHFDGPPPCQKLVFAVDGPSFRVLTELGFKLCYELTQISSWEIGASS
ncbi:MAG: DUF4780 domain-containing protein [Gammaproteobacteria bacterium]|nr:DUF4780 domain-containing protein [Gammaproteobacteria bacterium]